MSCCGRGLASLLERAGFRLVGQAGDGSELLASFASTARSRHRRHPHASDPLDGRARGGRRDPRGAPGNRDPHPLGARRGRARDDLLASGSRSGYLLKSRVTDIDEFLETLERVCRGGSVVDPSLVQELVAARRADDPLDALTPREREVLALMAEGRSNAGIGRRLWVTEGTVENHVHNIMAKLRLPETDDDHRRVLAVITFLPTLASTERAGWPALTATGRKRPGSSAVGSVEQPIDPLGG